MAERLLTPSKIAAWLDCDHYLTLKHQVDSGSRPGPSMPFGSFARLLQEKGLEHESAVLASYEADGRSVFRVDEKPSTEPFAEWAKRVLPALSEDADVIFQMPFAHDGVRGVADFLVRRVESETGRGWWEPVDAKLARSEAKPSHVLQLCFYAEALTALTGTAPIELRVSLGSGETESVGYEEVRPYWDRLRTQLRSLLNAEPGAVETRPEPCVHCAFCEFEATCDAVWRDEDSLVFVAGIRATERAAFEAAGVATRAALGARAEPVDGVRPERLDVLRTQAALQIDAEQSGESKPPFRLIERGDDPVWGRGFDQLPEPDPADLFLDFEGHPFWRPDRGLFFLFGFIAQDEPGTWAYHALWAHDEHSERQRVHELITLIEERRARHPGMHVYHYNHTERSALVKMTADDAVAESALADLVDAGVFVDLYVVARNAVQVGVESYGLKHLERLTDYERGHQIDKGAGAVVEFDLFTKDEDPAHLGAIAAYNEDDVRATRALRDWLVEHRPAGLAWRVTSIESDDEAPNVDDLLDRLAAFEEGTEQHLVADLLGYWLREWRAYIAPVIGTLTSNLDSHLDDPKVLAGLADAGNVELRTPGGKVAKWPGLQLTFPVQPLDRRFVDRAPQQVIYATPDGLINKARVDSLDIDAGTIVLEWNERSQNLAVTPVAVMVDEWVSTKSKGATLALLANQILDPATHGVPNPSTISLLRAELPAFRPGGGPTGGRFTDDADDLARWVTELDRSVLAVQGPPGTGKTYRGAVIAKALVNAGKRVGIMAMSHQAIENFLAEIADQFALDPPLPLRAIKKGEPPLTGARPGVTYTTTNGALANPDYDIVAGTSWQFAGRDLRNAPVDVLLIDEAGQLALVDAVVASMSAASVVLLGDPQQLPQVAQALHPGGSGASALGHLLGEHTTLPDDRGVFIEETRRMHPDVCRFISERIYEGRLASHPDCAKQSTGAGTGLRWLRADHTGCSTESEEEARLVSTQISSLLGTSWTDKHGKTRKIGVDDVMVVAPYNDQVRLVREHLDANPQTRGVRVGTVDKFQGGQAPVVLFTMTSSSASDMPRGTEFLFSKNRLNVAISRAQCLAYLVCTEELLGSRAKTVDDMLLIATLCAFVEYATADAGVNRLA